MTVEIDAKHAMWETLPFWTKGMSGAEAAEATSLLQIIVDDWMHDLNGVTPERRAPVYNKLIDGLNSRGKGEPSQRLATLRFEAFEKRLNRATFAAYLRAKRIIDGEATHDEVEGQQLLDKVEDLRKQAAVIDPANKTGADMQLSEAFLEANYVRRGGPFLSMRLGNYQRTKKG